MVAKINLFNALVLVLLTASLAKSEGSPKDSVDVTETELKIISPVKGMAVKRGDVFTLTVEYTGTESLEILGTMGTLDFEEIPLKKGSITAGIYNFEVKVKSDARLGAAGIAVIGGGGGAKPRTAEIGVLVDYPGSPDALKIDYPVALFSNVGEQSNIEVEAIYGDVSVRANELPTLILKSQNEGVAIVAKHAIRATGPGETVVVAEFRGKTAEIKVLVAHSVKGDLNGDDRVDKDDFNKLLSRLYNIETIKKGSERAKEKYPLPDPFDFLAEFAELDSKDSIPVRVPGDPFDINGDGKLSVEDLRELTKLCTRPKCIGLYDNNGDDITVAPTWKYAISSDGEDVALDTILDFTELEDTTKISLARLDDKTGKYTVPVEKFKLTSSNPSVIAIEGNTLIAKSLGKSLIQIDVEGETQAVIVRVSEKPPVISITSPKEGTKFCAGDEIKFEVTVTPPIKVGAIRISCQWTLHGCGFVDPPPYVVALWDPKGSGPYVATFKLPSKIELFNPERKESGFVALVENTKGEVFESRELSILLDENRCR